MLAGARFLWQHPVLRALTVLLTFYIFATQGLPDVLIFYIKHDLHQGDGVVGIVLAVAALGHRGRRPHGRTPAPQTQLRRHLDRRRAS